MTRMTLTALCLISIAPSQAEPHRPREIVDAAWREFTRDHGDAWTADWNPATATPKAIFGPGLRVEDGEIDSLDAARRHATRTLERFSVLLGRGQSVFVEDIAAKVRQVYVFVYRQEFRGLEVIGGRADVRVHATGGISMFGSQAVSVPSDFVTVPTVDAEEAGLAAYRARRIAPPRAAAAESRAGRLVIWADVHGAEPTVPRLAWEVGIDQREPELVVGRAFVDAHTGRELEWQDDVSSFDLPPRAPVERSAGPPEIPRVASGPDGVRMALSGTVTAWTNTGLSPRDPLTNIPLANVRVSASGVGETFTDARGEFSIPYGGSDPVDVTVVLRGRHVADVLPANGRVLSRTVSVTPGVPATIGFIGKNSVERSWSQTTVYWAMNEANVWMRNIVGDLPQLAVTSQMRATVNNVGCNPHFVGNSIHFYETTGSCNTSAYSTVIFHEWGHGADTVFGGRSNAPDGLSEAWGDIIAMYITRQPELGRDFSVNGGFVRTGLNAKTYPDGGFSSGGSTHAKGEVFMGFAWDVHVRLRRKLGNTPGRRRAEAIVIGSIVADATTQPDAVREIFVLDDDDMDLSNGTPNYTQLSAAARARNLPFPRRPPVLLSHTPLDTTAVTLAPRLVVADVREVDGHLDRLEVVYDAGDGERRRRLVPTRNGGEHVALLPGVSSPASVRYHIEADHSSGEIVRLPERDEFDYAVGEKTVLFREDFENGINGWTHARTRTQDDWQLGRPRGKSGVSSGVVWRDPSAPFSGDAVWGNDLGLDGFNGAYQPHIGNWLRSPILDMSGRTGVTLSFRRWLTIQDAAFDRATIRVNGTQVWQNPAGGDLLDDHWIRFELPLPEADDNRSVQLEWRLETDGEVHLGGWNIDDVELFSFRPTPAPKVSLRVTPEQVQLGQLATVTVRGTPGAAVVLVLSSDGGPTGIPGVGTLAVGTPFTAIPTRLDSGGQLSVSFRAPAAASESGTLLHLQVVQATASAIDISNPMLVLFD